MSGSAQASNKIQAEDNRGRTAYAACPLCGGKDIPVEQQADCTQHPLYKPVIAPVMTWKRCEACEHIFTSGYYTDASAKEIFSDTNPSQLAGANLEEMRPVSGRMVDKVLPYAAGAHWLDVGFGNGSLLFTAHEYGFTPVGLDVRGENVERMAGIGIEAHTTDLKELAKDPAHIGRYAVISMADVLEHVPFPREYLAAADALLSKDGVLFASMPNCDSVLWGVLSMNGVNPYWGEIEHFHNFGRRRLFSLLKECGFMPVNFGLSERYRACMEVIAKKSPKQ